MGDFDLLKFANAEELARAAARDWLTTIQARSATPRYVALSGGRIAARFFSAVAEFATKDGISLNNVHFFWGDERCVPAADPESNFNLANTHLLRPLSIPEGQIHRVPGEEPPEDAAAQAAAELCRFAPRGPENQPVLDLIFLGMGEDGHIASLFPGESDEVRGDKAVYRAVYATKPPPRRITLGYGAIVAGRNVWVLASGAGKKAALDESLHSGGQTPLARILKYRAHTRIYSDIV
jgi:6-phosphogluconolactonase